MPTPFTIRITSEILARAKFCGQKEQETIGDNCAIAIALQDMFPDVFVTGDHIHPFGLAQEETRQMTIALPTIARDFIRVFDSLVAIPRVRLRLPEFDFVILVPDEIIEQINIEDIQEMSSDQMDSQYSVIHSR